MEVDRRFADLGLGFVDGSVVALAQSLGIRRLATRDVRHFAGRYTRMPISDRGTLGGVTQFAVFSLESRLQAVDSKGRDVRVV
jgi:hypothetical protein